MYKKVISYISCDFTSCIAALIAEIWTPHLLRSFLAQERPPNDLPSAASPQPGALSQRGRGGGTGQQQGVHSGGV